MHDDIIVGAGSAGCVLAARLSEDPDVSVLLIEAGPPDTYDNIHIPLGVTALSHSEVDWDYSTGCEPHCDGRRIFLPRGRTLGGSSSTNAMVYIRGNPADYDGWRDAGCSGWGYDDLLPCFERSLENLTVSEGRSRNVMMEAFVEAARALGAGRSTTIARYVFPNVIQSVPVIFTLNAADAILTLAALGFLGYGVHVPSAEWGYDISKAISDAANGFWWTSLFPGLAILGLTTGLTLLGEGINDFVNPLLRRRGGWRRAGIGLPVVTSGEEGIR